MTFQAVTHDDLPPLSTGVVHVWRVDLDRDGEASETEIILLTPDEVERAGRFRFARD